MIPVLLLIGLLAGRWYVAALAGLAWPLLLALDDIIAPDDFIGAAALAVANTAVGVAVHKLVAWALRQAWRKAHPHVREGGRTQANGCR